MAMLATPYSTVCYKLFQSFKADLGDNLNEDLSQFTIFAVNSTMSRDRGIEQLMKTISSGVVPFEFETNSS